jgi:hypothetical protein
LILENIGRIVSIGDATNTATKIAIKTGTFETREQFRLRVQRSNRDARLKARLAQGGKIPQQELVQYFDYYFFL